jgi:copper(I)-binding protein
MLVIMALVAGACGAGSDGVVISNIRLGQPTGPNAALYFTATNGGQPDRLLGAETDVAATVEIHETTTDTEGAMGMRAVEAVELGAGDSLELEPGGLHMMLVDVSRLAVGDTVEVTLIWERAGSLSLEAEVVDPSDTMGDDR